MTRRRVVPGLGDRGRVPFALVGVLLVVTSALFAAVQQPSRPPEPAVDTAMERTTADARAAFRGAVAVAGVEAASNPVITPANTSYGAVIDGETGFRDALRIRVYLAARERFASVGRTHRGVDTTVSVPAVTDPATLELAKERVSVERAGPDGHRLRAAIRNVSQTATRDGRVVGERTTSFTVTVDSPVLAVHDRVDTYQTRLDAAVAKPGLSRRVTARLYPVAWARGYAQYGGAPIENVVATRHVELVTNGAVLGVQRSVFGEADPDGRRAHGTAVAGTALTEALGRASGPVAPVDDLLIERVTAATEPTERRGVAAFEGTDAAPDPNETTTVRVGESAVRAFRPFAYREGDPSERGRSPLAGTAGLNETVQTVYSERVRLLTAVDASGAADPGPPDPPTDHPGWHLVGERTVSDVTSVTATGDGPDVSVPTGYHSLREFDRAVRVQRRHVRLWHNGQRTVVTTNAARSTRRVSVVVAGDHHTADHAPDREIERVHEPGGPYGGSNLADVSDRVDAYVARTYGGDDGLAAAAARGTVEGRPVTVRADWPAELPADAYPELVALREQLRNVSVAVERATVGTYEVNPAAALRDRVESRRVDLVDAPATYDTVAAKARVELRARYVDRVIARLDARAEARADRASGFDQRVRESGGSLDLLRAGRQHRRLDGADDSGDLSLTVDGAPPYLTTDAVTHDRVAAVDPGATVYPLKTENVNAFTIPYGDATDGAVDWLTNAVSGPPQTDLRTGAQALGAAESATAATDDPGVAEERAALEGDVAASLDAVRRALLRTLARHGVGDGRADRRRVVEAAFDRWDTPRERALAVADRRVVAAVVAEAAAHESTEMDPVARDRLRLDLRATVTRSLDSGRATVDGPAVEAVTDEVKAVLGDRVANASRDALDERFNESVTGMPAGLPLAPVPGYWYATANVWVVNVHGRYERFAVETPRRTPTPADADLSYVRDGANVTLDVDRDGRAERLGRADRVTLSVQTAVVVVVPPGGTGVGDVDGNMQERSAGWSELADANSSGGSAAGPGNGSDDGTAVGGPDHATRSPRVGRRTGESVGGLPRRRSPLFDGAGEGRE